MRPAERPGREEKTMLDILSVILIALGALCIVVAVVGVFRMDYILNRMHATTIADTLGTFLVLLGAALHLGLSWATAKLALILIFQWATCPISAHLIARLIYDSQTEDLKKHAEITYAEDKEGTS